MKSSNAAIRLLDVFWGILVSTMITTSISSSDYYFRPANLAMVGDWQKTLTFVVSNPGDKAIALEVGIKAVGVMPADMTSMPVGVEVAPSRILLRAGARELITVTYAGAAGANFIPSYEVWVEQLPLLYVSPGQRSVPTLMNITRYVAEIEVRQQLDHRQYAMTAIEREEPRTVLALPAESDE